MECQLPPNPYRASVAGAERLSAEIIFTLSRDLTVLHHSPALIITRSPIIREEPVPCARFTFLSLPASLVSL